MLAYAGIQVILAVDFPFAGAFAVPIPGSCLGRSVDTGRPNTSHHGEHDEHEAWISRDAFVLFAYFVVMQTGRRQPHTAGRWCWPVIEAPAEIGYRQPRRVKISLPIRVA